MSARHDIQQAAAVAAILRASNTAARLRDAAEQVRLLECQRDDADAILRAIASIDDLGRHKSEAMFADVIGMARAYVERHGGAS